MEPMWPSGKDLEPKPEDLSDSSWEDELDGEEKPYRCQHCSKVFCINSFFYFHLSALLGLFLKHGIPCAHVSCLARPGDGICCR